MSKKFFSAFKKSGTSNKKESWPLSDTISTKPTSAPIEFKALNSIGADVGFVEIVSDKGHDSFLLDVPDFLNALKNFLDKSYTELKNEKWI